MSTGFGTLNVNAKLFSELKKSPPGWWNNLTQDPDFYADIRKENKINVYYNGGSIMELSYTSTYRAKIHFEYIPIARNKSYIPYNFNSNGDVSFPNITPLEANNYNPRCRNIIKKRVEKFYPNHSEKGIQGKYVTSNKNNMAASGGFFIDTEFQYLRDRIDLVWVDLNKRKIFFVELKCIDDGRLYHKGGIDTQLEKYRCFVMKHKKELIEYYAKIYQIKKSLNLIQNHSISSINNFDVEEHPILLIGDCTENWIKDERGKLENMISDIAYGCFYQGAKNNKFIIPNKTIKHKILF